MVTLIVFGIIAYLHFGYLLADLSLKVRKEKDGASLLSFLLFPVSHHRGRMGDKDAAPLGSLFDLKSDVNGPGPATYKCLMTVFWPIKMIINTPALLLYGGIDGVAAAVRALAEARAKAVAERLKREPSLVPSADDDVSVLFAKRQEIVSRMEILHERKRAIDEELERRKAVMDAIFEIEGSLDPEVRRSVAPGAKESA